MSESSNTLLFFFFSFSFFFFIFRIKGSSRSLHEELIVKEHLQKWKMDVRLLLKYNSEVNGEKHLCSQKKKKTRFHTITGTKTNCVCLE